MSIPTAGESAFEAFCSANLIPFRKIKEEGASTPDYEIVLAGTVVYAEIKDIQEDENFGTPVKTRIVGSHVRAKIGEAKPQLQPPARVGSPTILLIYNALDPYQTFGTEEHDFLAAMYGELTVSINLDTKQVSDSYHGRNRSLAPNKNTSFSAVGAIYTRGGKLSVVLYENVFAKNPLSYSSLPACFVARRVQMEAN
jgi:hypothetical protein